MTDKKPSPPKPRTLEERRALLWDIAPMFVEGTPHAGELGIKFVSVDIGRAAISLPYNPKLIGNAQTRVIAGGAVTTLLDQCSGLAATSAFENLTAVATLDLRIDYMRAAEPGKTIIADARCYKTTRNVAFVRAIAHDGDPDDPIATAQSCFMTTPSGNRSHNKADKGGPQKATSAEGQS